MPIEKELEKLHEHLKALGSAREKLNGATEHIENVSDAIVNAGESMRRLAEMPELTERIRSSVERLSACENTRTSLRGRGSRIAFG